jgi:hypothetical protein
MVKKSSLGREPFVEDVCILADVPEISNLKWTQGVRGTHKFNYSGWPFEDQSQNKRAHRALRSVLEAGCPIQNLAGQIKNRNPFLLVESNCQSGCRTIYAFPFEARKEPLNGADAIAKLGQVWRSGGNLTESLMNLVDGLPHMSLQRFTNAITKPSLESMLELCEEVLIQFQWKRSPNFSLRRASTIALSNPSYDGECIQALASVARSRDVAVAVLRGEPAGWLLESCIHVTARAEFLTCTRADSSILAARVVRGLCKPLGIDEAMECLRVRACLQDPSAAAVGLCAVDKATIYKIPRVKSALSELLIDLVEPEIHPSVWEGFEFGGREYTKASWLFPSLVDLESVGRGLLGASIASTCPAMLNPLKCWSRVVDMQIIEELRVLHNPLRVVSTVMGSVEVTLTEDYTDIDVIVMRVANQIVAEINWTCSALSLPPSTDFKWNQSFNEHSVLSFLTDVIGYSQCGILLACSATYLQKSGRARLESSVRFLPFCDAETPEEVARSASTLTCSECRKEALRCVDLRLCILLRVMGLKLLGATQNQAVLGSTGDHWIDTRLNLSYFRGNVIVKLLDLVDHIKPESEAYSMIERSIKLMNREWLSCKGAIVKEPPANFKLPDEISVISSENSDQCEKSVDYLTKINLQEAVEYMNNISMTALTDLHNRFDLYGMEIRRRIASETLLIRIFNRDSLCSEVSAFVLSRGTIKPPDAVTFVRAIVGALPKRKRLRQ